MAMTTHELAAILLAGPDTRVGISIFDPKDSMGDLYAYGKIEAKTQHDGVWLQGTLVYDDETETDYRCERCNTRTKNGETLCDRCADETEEELEI